MLEQTLIIIKPDGIQRRLAGEIITRFEKKGLKLTAAKLVRLSPSLAQKHYEMHKGKDFFQRAVEYISSAPVLLMVWQGERAIEVCRKMLGSTDGCNAQSGTIRGDYSCSVQHNLVHASDSAESAEREIALYFPPQEIFDYDMPDNKWL